MTSDSSAKLALSSRSSGTSLLCTVSHLLDNLTSSSHNPTVPMSTQALSFNPLAPADDRVCQLADAGNPRRRSYRVLLIHVLLSQRLTRSPAASIDVFAHVKLDTVQRCSGRCGNTPRSYNRSFGCDILGGCHSSLLVDQWWRRVSVNLSAALHPRGTRSCSGPRSETVAILYR